MHIGLIGLQDDGWLTALRLKNAGHEILVYDEDLNLRNKIAAEGITPSPSIEDLSFTLESKRLVWIFCRDEIKMDEILETLVPHLSVSDIIIAGNPLQYENTARRCKEVQGFQIDLLDCNFQSTTAFIGGNRFAFNYCEKMFKEIATIEYCGLCGTGILRKQQNPYL